MLSAKISDAIIVKKLPQTARNGALRLISFKTKDTLAPNLLNSQTQFTS